MNKHKMTEDEVVLNLSKWLKKEGWSNIQIKLGQEKGNDIEAERKGIKLIIEAKEAKGNAKNTKKEKFNNSQIRTHFGIAIVKILEQKTLYPKAMFGIAQPYDEDIINAVKDSIE